MNLPDVESIVREIFYRESGIQHASQTLDFIGDSFFKFGFELRGDRLHKFYAVAISRRSASISAYKLASSDI